MIPGAGTPAAVPTVAVVFESARSFEPYIPRYNGKQVKLVILDDGAEPSKAAANAKRLLTQENVQLMVLSSFSSTFAPKPRKLTYREQQEWEQMESAILAAEEAVAGREAEVAAAATAGHAVLADACRALEEAQRAVEQLYARWQELDAKRSGAT